MPPPPSNVPAAAEQQYASLQAQRVAEGEQLAASLARAMAEQRFREELRDALRDSRVTDHKVVLQEYAAKLRSRDLDDSSPWRLVESLTALPVMDLYLPFRDHRRSWRATDDILVAVAFDAFAPTLNAYDVDGRLVPLRLEDGVPSRPLVIVHPAEPTFPLSTQYTAGLSALCEPDPGAMEDDCNEGGGGGGGGGPTPPAPGVYITGFFSPRGDGWFGSLEMQFFSQVRSGSVSTALNLANNVVWFFDQQCSKGSATGVFEPNTEYTNLQILLSPGVTNVGSAPCPSGGAPSEYLVSLVESDGGFNGDDDDFGRRFYGVLGGGFIPWNASVSTFQDFYSCSATTFVVYPECPPQYSARVRLEYR